MSDDAQDLLMEEWAKQPDHDGGAFIRDGIIDPDRWAVATRRVLVLLKEGYEETGQDLRELIRVRWEGAKYTLSWNIARWCYLIHYADPLVPSFPYDEESRKKASDALLASAVVNIKKSGGVRTSASDELIGVAQRDGDFIRRQIDLIGPEIVICGYVWDAVKPLWPDAHCLFDAVWRAGSRTFVDFWHPASRYPMELSYYALGCLLQRAGILGFTGAKNRSSTP